MKQLYVYYRMAPQHLDEVQRCVTHFFCKLQELGVERATLHRRLGQHTPYITLMEVIELPDHLNLSAFQTQVDALVAHCFSGLSEPLTRTVEIFESV